MSEESVRDIVMKSPSSTCSMDPILTWMLKERTSADYHKIISLSFVNGIFPDSLKSARITPLIKKYNLDISDILKIIVLLPTYLFLPNLLREPLHPKFKIILFEKNYVENAIRL